MCGYVHLRALAGCASAVAGAQKVWRHCLHPPVCLLNNSNKKKEHLVGCTSRAKQEHVALTTADCGQILAGCG